MTNIVGATSLAGMPTAGYPKHISLRDGGDVLVRPIEQGDEARLLEFFRQIPEDERFFLKDDVTSPSVVRSWVDQGEGAFALVAVQSGRVVAESVLLSRRGKARSHFADVRIVVAPDFRNRGLGSALVRELCDVACNAGLSGVLLEVVEGAQADALAAGESLGFVRVGHLYSGAIDQSGQLRDVALLAMPLRSWHESSAL
jgi:GNAT superfamily N-acetyltransferase